MIMAEELIFTSVSKGLKSGSDGYCTVAYTDGMSANAVKFLESISDYSFLSLDDPNLNLSPVSYRHYRHRFGNQIKDIISRVAFSGFDYTKRSNKLAHHILLSPEELPPAGPAWLCAKAEAFFETDWNKEPELRKYRKQVPQGVDELNSELSTWGDMAGDAGWGGKLAETFLSNPDKPSYIVYDIKDSHYIIELIRESLLLLPPEKRWDVTFNTYFTGVRSVECAWRCCLKDAPVLARARGVRGTLIIDLSSRTHLPKAEGGELVRAAREGKIAYKQQPVRESEPMPEKVPSLPDSEPESHKIELFGSLKDQQPEEIHHYDEKVEVAKIADDSLAVSQDDAEKIEHSSETYSKKIVVSSNEKKSQGMHLSDGKSAGKQKLLILLACCLGIILVFAFATIIKQHKAQIKLQAKIQEMVDKSDSQQAITRGKMRNSQIAQPAKVETELKTHIENVKLPVKSLPEKHNKSVTVNKLRTIKSLDVKEKKTVDVTKNEQIWRLYQKAVRKPGHSNCKILLPPFTPGATLDLVWREGKEMELSGKGAAPKKVDDGIVVNSIEGAGLGLPVEICKFSVKLSQNNTTLTVEKYRDSESLIDLSNDIKALKLGSELYPLQYQGNKMLPAGKGEVLDLLSVKAQKKKNADGEGLSKTDLKLKNEHIGTVKPLLEIRYVFSDDDLLADLNNTKKYAYDLRYKDIVLPLNPEVSNTDVKYYLIYNRNIPELKKIFMEAALMLHSDFSDSLKQIRRDGVTNLRDNVSLSELEKILLIRKREYSAAVQERSEHILEPFKRLETYIEATLKKSRIKPNAKKDACRRVLNKLLADLRELESRIKKSSIPEFRKYLADTHIKKVYLGGKEENRRGKNGNKGILNELNIPLDLVQNIREIKTQLATLDLMGIKETLDAEMKTVEQGNPLASDSAILKCINLKKSIDRGPAGVMEVILQRDDLRERYDASLKLVFKQLSMIIRRLDNGREVKNVTF